LVTMYNKKRKIVSPKESSVISSFTLHYMYIIRLGFTVFPINL